MLSLKIFLWGWFRAFGFVHSDVNTANSSGQYGTVERNEKGSPNLCYDLLPSTSETWPPPFVLFLYTTDFCS